MRTLYTNGTVITMDHGRPQAEALVTEGNRFRFMPFFANTHTLEIRKVLLA